MKNFTLLLATILISISAIAAELNGGTKLYLNPGPWDVDGAVFVAYYWGDPNGDQWSDFNDSDNDGIFETTVPNGAWTGLKFVRMNPAGDIHNWDNKWNETDDLTYDGTNNLYTITGWNSNEGTWSSFGSNEGGNDNPNKPATSITDGSLMVLVSLLTSLVVTANFGLVCPTLMVMASMKSLVKVLAKKLSSAV